MICGEKAVNLKKNIMVSICCITYNQEKYIRKTLDSFLSQKTTFPYEIIIHDDCSTDNTIDIIKEYQEKYPEIVKPIFEEENQYSKGIDVIPIVFGQATGKYAALCDGDDYWCDDQKIQKQFEFMEKHPECSLVTNGCYLEEDSTGKRKIKSQPYRGSRHYSIDDIILYDGGLFATNSMFFKLELVRTLPKFYFLVSVGDFPLIIHLALCGKVYFMEDIMSVYRVNAIGSWSAMQNKGKNRSEIIQKRKKFDKDIFAMMNEVNQYTNYKYAAIIEQFILKRKFAFCILSSDFKTIKNKKFKMLYKSNNAKENIKLFIARNLSFIYKLKQLIIK